MPPAAPGAAAAHWQVQLLGRVQAVSSQRTVERWPTRAVACLLARLAMAPQRAHPREELIDLLWPDAPPQAGRSRLRQALSQLRSLLEPPDATWPPLLLADRQAVRIAAGALACDVLQFEQAMAAGDAGRACSLYVGDFMPGHYDDWVLAERRRLEELSARLARRGAAPGARQALAGAAAGRPHTAPVAAPADRPPDGSTHASPVAPPAPPGRPRAIGSLPDYWTRAFGTSQPLARLRGTVVTERLVTLLGPGGSGKTRLACELAHALLEPAAPAGPQAAASAPPHAPFEHVLFAPLADCRDAATVVDALLRLLRPAGSGDPVVRLADALGAAPTLAVFDNVEQLDDAAAALVESLLHAAPSLHVLLTSRRRLHLDGERIVELPGLALAAPEADIETAMTSPAVALFVDRARASRPDFHLTAGNVGPVVSLTRILGGMPLAIELAASRLRALQPAELLDRLRAGAGSPMLDLLARPSVRAGARSRHASMRHVVAWSWEQLRPEAAQLLRALSVLPAPASAETAACAFAALGPPAGGSDTGLALTRVQALLAEALETSLLRAVPDGSGGTLYSLLPPVREYAAEQCGADEPRRVRAALRLALAALARSAAGQRGRRFESETPQVAALIETAPGDDALEQALDLAVALRRHWNQQPLSAAVLAVLEQAVGATGDPARASSGSQVLAGLWLLSGRPERARALAERALALAPDPAQRAFAQVARVTAAMYLAQDIGAIDGWLAEALVDAESSGDDMALLDVLRAQAMVAVNLHEDYARAEGLVERCMRLHERHGDLPRLRLRQLDLAACLGWTGRESAAAALLEACIADARRAEETLTTLGGLVQLGRVRLRLRRSADAAAALEAAVRLATRSHQHTMLLWALLHLPEAWATSGRAEPAALLHGYITAAWARQMGPVNRIEAREVRRARRLIVHLLGAARAAALQEAGRALAPSQVLGMLPPEPAEAGPAPAA